MKTRFPRRAAALLLALACSLLTLPAAAAEVSVTLDRETLTLNVGGAGQRLTATTNPPGMKVSWKSSNENAATVDDNGFVTPVAEGAATIEASIDGAWAECRVTVGPKPVFATSVTVTPDTLTLYLGDPDATVTASVDDKATDKSVTIESLNTSVVTVNQRPGSSSATLTPVSAGNAVVRATANDGSGKYGECKVTVKTRPLSVTITDPKTKRLSLPPGETYTLEAEVTGSDREAAAKGVIWSSSNYDAVNVNSSTGDLEISSSPDYIGARVTITARAAADPSADDACTIYITGIPTSRVESVIITSNSNLRYVERGSTITLEAVAYPEDAYEKDREIKWSSDHPEIARVDESSGVVTGVAPGEATITAKANGDNSKLDTRAVETSGFLLSYRPSGSAAAESLTQNSVVDMYQYHDITVLTELFGNAKNKRVILETSNPSVAGVGDGLRVTANYPGESIITATVEGTGYTSKFKVKVAEDVADAINVNMGSSAAYSFSGLLSELDRRSQSKAGGPLDSISNLRVSTENGVLYYGYTSPENPGRGVGGSDRLYYQPSQTQLAVKNVTFVPTPGFDGTAIVEYTGTATSGNTFNGTIRITAAASGDVTYTTEMNQPVAFAAEHFSAVCMGRTGQSVRYVNFTQPAANRGTLYYNYSPSGQYSPKVVSSTAYYVSGNPSIDGVTFVPAENYAGSVSIPYRCIDSSGASFTGTVTVTVSSAGGGASSTGDVEYSIARNQRLTFRAADFTSACQRVIGGTLDYIRFTDLPTSAAGVLYQSYTNSSSTRLVTGRNYYRNSSPYISNISFVPATNYSGTVTIPFTAANTSGDTFSGTLVIHVDASVGTVHYSTPRNQAVTFSAADFNSASRRVNGVSLNYVRFTSLPSSSAGTLYQNYANSSSTRAVTGRNYYRSGSPSLSSLTFVPAAGYSGTVTIPFTAYDDNGDIFSGTVTIQVYGSSPVAGGGIRYTGSSAPVAFRSSDFQNLCQMMLGNPLSYVQFTSLPTVGRLSQNYAGPAQTGTGVSTAARYSAQDLDQISYLPKAEYQGTLYVSYTLYDTQGVSHSSSVEIQLSKDYNYSSFYDISDGYWASPSIEFLRYSGITNGYGNNTYRPAQSISRGEFTLMICRAFQFPTTGSSGFPDVPANSSYAGAVASARNLGIVEGNNGLFQPDRPITRQSAMTMICRAMDAAGQAAPAADTGLLYSYADGGQVSAFARSSVASLVQMGVVQGNNSNRLNPTAAISRAEMAVILHRVLTR